MTTISDLITSLGGPQELGQRLNIRPNTISVWMHRQRLPRSVWPDLMAAHKHVSIDMLLALEAASTPKTAPASAAVTDG